MGEGGGGGGEAGMSQEVIEEERKHFKKITNSFLYYKLVGTVDTAVSDRAKPKGGCLYCAICYKLRLEERVEKSLSMILRSQEQYHIALPGQCCVSVHHVVV